jgi:hypothetical protein
MPCPTRFVLDGDHPALTVEGDRDTVAALEFPRFGGQGLITQPQWLVSL